MYTVAFASELLIPTADSRVLRFLPWMPIGVRFIQICPVFCLCVVLARPSHVAWSPELLREFGGSEAPCCWSSGLLSRCWSPLQCCSSLSLYVSDEGVRGKDLRVSYCTEVYANYFFLFWFLSETVPKSILEHLFFKIEEKNLYPFSISGKRQHLRH
jgi:hypothetical protein